MTEKLLLCVKETQNSSLICQMNFAVTLEFNFLAFQDVEDSKNSKKVKSSDQMNIRGVYLHVLGDALGSVIVICSALAIYYGKGKWTLYVDPVMR